MPQKPPKHKNKPKLLKDNALSKQLKINSKDVSERALKAVRMAAAEPATDEAIPVNPAIKVNRMVTPIQIIWTKVLAEGPELLMVLVDEVLNLPQNCRKILKSPVKS